MNVAHLHRTARRLRLAIGGGRPDSRPGSSLSLLRGVGRHFVGYRPYQFGDDIRQMDWNITARMARPVARTYRMQHAVTLALVLDGSASMRAAGGAQWRAACEAAALLAFVAAHEFAAVGATIVSDTIEGELRPGRGAAHARSLARWLDGFRPRGTGTALSVGINRAARRLPSGGVLVILSDFADPLWDTAVRRLARQHAVVGIAMAPRADRGWPDVGLVRVRDAETGRRLWIDTAAPGTRRRLVDAAVRAARDLRRRLACTGARWVECRAGAPVAPQLRRLFARRSD